MFCLTGTQDTDGNTLIYYVKDNTNTLHQLTDNNDKPGSNDCAAAQGEKP